ncbi:proline iminopeptidase-family hydrolase [Pelagibacterium flavum]|uniref:Proline iminopeptidase-family hydrolase n=1 Tax=Pelagibacterium flavum TaxID=2984530 RepID=A0ABY6IU72_9HYPH|nr:proline iminopeptidase-family hydrolase [Pelagibacterium sp. YIM 151497]UYQ74158.1 proline iminopeptidase-family hydrolase [Pelagibacterium sp. YIM 151497]
MDIHEGFCAFGDHQTWYRITGDVSSGLAPVVIAHGGPGCTHDYVDAYQALAASGRAVVHYDQIGNGRSSHLPDAPADFWTVDLFLTELENLTRHLGIAGRYNLLGQSWGGMLAAEHAVRRPAGLNAVVIANSPASLKLWVEEANRLRRALPDGVHETLLKYEEIGAYDDPAYREAADTFYRAHVCRMAEWPDEVKRTFAAMDEDTTVYRTMNGPTEFHVIGTLKGWTIEDRLHAVAVPTLVLSGLYDEATPRTVEAYANNIPGAEWIILGKSSHMPHVEEHALCMAVVSDFLARND